MPQSIAFLTPYSLALRKVRLVSSHCPRKITKMTSIHTVNSSVAFVLSHFEASHLLSLRKFASDHATHVSYGLFSVDIGKRELDAVLVHPEGISVNDGNARSRVLATWSELKKMSKKGRPGAYEIFLDGESQPAKIAGLSKETNMPASLLPMSPNRPPTLVLGGFGMHRMKGTDPADDTASKIAAIGPKYLRGHVLDICTGLGYTAIEASRTNSVTSVTTIELDPFVVDIQGRNPWSQELFSNPQIHRIVGNATEVVKDFSVSSFDTIIHDPPAQVVGGELYGMDFYKELSRICVKEGKLFHYIGDPRSAESGRLFRGVMERLEKAGFRKIVKCPSAYGVTAIRS